MDQNIFEQRRAQSDYTEALREVQREIGSQPAGTDEQGRKLKTVGMSGADAEKELNRRGKLSGSMAETDKADPYAGREWLRPSDNPLDELNRTAEVTSLPGRAAVQKATGRQVGDVSTFDTERFMHDQKFPMPGEINPDAPFAGAAQVMSGVGALGMMVGTDPTNLIPGSAPAKAGKAAKALKGGKVLERTAPVATIKTEQDLKKLVDGPVGAGRTFVLMTEDNPKMATQSGFESGSLSRLAGQYESYKVRGYYSELPENSVMIVSPKANDKQLLTSALRWAKASGQESIATNDGILYVDGRLNPRKGPSIYGEEAKLQPGYSIIESESGEVPFSMSIDWDKTVSGAYQDHVTGVNMSAQRFLSVPAGEHFLGDVPKGLSYKDLPRYRNEVKLPGTAVYDFKDNPLNLPETGYEQALKDAGYRAAIRYQDDMPSLQTLGDEPVSRTIDRPRAFYGPETGVPMGAPRVVYPAAMPERVAAAAAEGNISDPQVRKDLVQMGAAILAQPEMSTAKPRINDGYKDFVKPGGKGYEAEQYGSSVDVKVRGADGSHHIDAVKGLNEGHALARAKSNWPGMEVENNVALKKGDKKQFSTRLGRNFKFNAQDDLTHEDLQDALAYLSAEDQSADPAVRGGWEKLIAQVEKQFDEAGIKVEYVDGQPYASSKEMIDDFKKTGTLKVSKDFNEHPVFTPEQNLKFRAVHDYKGHIEPDTTFGMEGERGAYKSHVDSIEGDDAKDALRVEVLGQASSMLASGGKFPKQKLFNLKAQRDKLGLVEGASADLFGSWVRQIEERLPETARGKVGLDDYRDLFNESVKAYTKHLKAAEGELPNTKKLIEMMNDSHGRQITDWYSTAWPELTRLFGEDADLMARFIALYSPQADVKMNVDRAFGAYRAYKLGERDPIALSRAAGVDKAEKYDALNHNMARTLRGEELAGRKVSNFYAAIKGDPNAVVIDRHMGSMFGYADVLPDDAYSFIEEHVRMLAAETGMAPADAQATLWGSWKALKGQGGELKNLDEFLREAAQANPDLIGAEAILDEAGRTRLSAAWLLTKIVAGGAAGGTFGDNPEEQIKNALIGAGLGAVASKPIWQKVGNAIRENRPAKWFKPAGQSPAPTVPKPLSPQEVMAQADAEAQQKARLDALRNKPKTVTVGEKTYELDMQALNTPEQLKQAVDEMAKVYREQIDNGGLTLGSRGTIPNALARRLGEHLNLTQEDVLNRVRGSVGPVEHVFAYADVLDAAKGRAMQSYELYNAGNKSFEKELLGDIDRYVKVGYQLDGLLEELGRGLQAAGQPDVKALTQGFRSFSGPFEIMQKHGSLNGDSVAALVKEVGLERTAAIGKAVEKAGLWDMVAEVTYGFVLSNPISAAVNVGSGAVLNPLISVMSRGLAEIAGSGAVVEGEAAAMLFGYYHGAQRLMRAVADTYKKGGAIELMRGMKSVKPLGKEADKSGLNHSITGANVSELMPKPFQFDPQGLIGRLVDGLGSAIRVGPALMELGDHLSYAVNLDMAQAARAFREGHKLGKTGAELEAFVNKEMLNPTREIRQEAERFAMHEIFKAPIEGFSGKIVEGLGHPALRPFITFVRTPVNIFKYNLEGMPLLNLTQKAVRDDIAAGGARRDLAVAKMVVGSTVLGTAAILAMNDRLTGAGPQDPKMRALWSIDHQPYSVKVPGLDKWVSYRRFDPIAAWMGTAADAAMFMKFDKDDLTGGEMAMAGVLGLMRNFTDKTYTRDTFEFLDQLTVRPGETASSSLEALDRYLEKKATAYIPWSSLTRAARNAVDPNMREAFDLSEKFMNGIPGLSNRLPMKLDFFGDPITNPRYNAFLPFPLKDNTGDDVIDEMIEMRAAVGMPSKQLDGQDLTTQEYHDLVEARGKHVKAWNGKDLREALIDLFNTNDYRKKDTTNAARKLMIEKLVEGYNMAAVDYMADGGRNERFLKFRQAQKQAEAISGQKLNLNFGVQ
jgi:hypothetical protein